MIARLKTRGDPIVFAKIKMTKEKKKRKKEGKKEKKNKDERKKN